MNNIKKLSLILIMSFVMVLVAMGSVSAANQTVNNTTNVTEIQNIISGTNSTNNLSAGDTITFSPGTYLIDKGFLINQSININASGAVFIGNNINQSVNNVNNHGLHITAPNVNVTGGSFSGFYYGISVNVSTSPTNVKIVNSTVNNNRRGIELTNVNGVIITNTRMINNTREGINFGGNNISISNSNISYNGFEGVHGHSSNSIIANCTINYNGFGASGTSTMPGLDLHGHGAAVENFTLEGNTVMYNAGEGLALNIQKATVKNNTFSNNNGNGITIKSSNYNATNNLIDNNIITNNKGNGIEVNSAGNSQNREYSASNNIISNNAIYNNNNNGILFNKISPSRQGTNDTGSIVENNTVTGNRIYDNGGDGVKVLAENNTIKNNNIFNNHGNGITTIANFNVLENNTISGNALLPINIIKAQSNVTQVWFDTPWGYIIGQQAIIFWNIDGVIADPNKTVTLFYFSRGVLQRTERVPAFVANNYTDNPSGYWVTNFTQSHDELVVVVIFPEDTEYLRSEARNSTFVDLNNDSRRTTLEVFYPSIGLKVGQQSDIQIKVKDYKGDYVQSGTVEIIWDGLWSFTTELVNGAGFFIHTYTQDGAARNLTITFLGDAIGNRASTYADSVQVFN